MDPRSEARMKQAEAILFGKTAAPEVGFGTTSNNAFFRTTRNPGRRTASEVVLRAARAQVSGEAMADLHQLEPEP